MVTQLQTRRLNEQTFQNFNHQTSKVRDNTDEARQGPATVARTRQLGPGHTETVVQCLEQGKLERLHDKHHHP